MKLSYLTSQTKQFLVSSVAMLFIAALITVSNTFNSTYLIQADAKSISEQQNNVAKTSVTKKNSNRTKSLKPMSTIN